MGLFGKKEVKEQQRPQEQGQKAQIRNEYDSTWVSITDKMLRVEMVADKARLEPVLIRADDNHIRLICRGILIAEVGKRGKAYKELEPFVGQIADIMDIEARTGEYGEFYRLGLKFKKTVIEF